MNTEILKNTIRANRPNITDSSIRTYVSILSNLYKRVFPNDTEYDVKKFSDAKTFINYLKDTEYNKRKTILASLVVISNSKDYNTLMLEDIEKHKAQELKQEKTQKQKDNWLEFDEIKKVVDREEKNAKLIYSKEKHTPGDLQWIQNYILLCLTTGIYIPPRRSVDWIMKWKNYDESKDNYVDLKKNMFVFQNYKTAKVYHKIEVMIPKKLKNILVKWFSVNPTDFVLFDKYFHTLNASKITERLNNVFGKKLSTSMLRHIFITDKFADVNLQDIADTATAMGNRPMEVLQYVKH